MGDDEEEYCWNTGKDGTTSNATGIYIGESFGGE
jgi:hypothetical protein